jgi:hypothetical protein
MVAVQGVGAEGVGKPLGSRSSDVGCGSGATDFRCPRHVRHATDGDTALSDASGQPRHFGRGLRLPLLTQ